MNKIQQTIIDTYQSKPRHFVQILKRNKELMEYVELHTKNLGLSSLLEKLFYVAYEQNNICPKGNIKPLKTFNGYSFCGRANTCECAKNSVSNSVSLTKSLYTEKEKDAINVKREKTTLELYGVKNVGQIEDAKLKHREFYNNEIKVSAVVQGIKETKKEKYGDENYNNRDQAEKTCMERYKVRNPWSLNKDKQNPLLIYLKDKEKLIDLFPKYSVQEIAEKLNVHTQTVYHYLNLYEFRDPYQSTFEKEIIFYLEELGITNIVSNTRKIIKKELDIYLPDYNLAIEYNGLYWHHEGVSHITKQYHYDKFKKCEEKGIELFSIFGDSWEKNKDIWKEKIKFKLGKCDKKVFARNTTIVELSPADTRYFLEKYHIQGYCTSSICYGLEYNNEVVAIMTFSKPRFNIGKNRGENAYELVRFVTSCSIPGGASKLLSHFIKAYNPNVVYSYSDNTYSNGNLYKVLGFTLEHEYKAGYWYFSPEKKKSYHRSNFTKYKLVDQGFDQGLTESEIMYNRGFLRIWDCGNRTWILELKKDDISK